MLLRRFIRQALRTSRYRFFRNFAYIGPKNVFVYFVAQRVLRINSHVPWPVHWASNVSWPERITMRDWRPYPGFLPGQYIQARNGIQIGKNVRLGPGVKLVSASHALDDFSKHEECGSIVIGDNCWLGANAILLPGVELGDHVVVAAGAVVSKSVPRNSLVGGVPAKVIRQLNDYTGDSSKW